MQDPSPFTSCSCTTPVPVERATHKGAAQTVCARCEKPLRLTFGSDEQTHGPRWVA
jgi:hypothetical protein